MDRASLLLWLSITDSTLDELLAAGLPLRTDGTFDGHQVATWLERRGLAQRTEFTGTLSTLGEVAKAFGVARDTVKKDWRSSGMPGSPGHYDLAAIDAWKKSRDRNPLSDSSEAQGLQSLGSENDQNQLLRRRLTADVRAKEEKVRELKRDNAHAEGAFLPRDDVERWLTELIITTRTHFQGLSRKLMPRFPREIAFELKEEIDREIASILSAMATWRPSTGETLASENVSTENPTTEIENLTTPQKPQDCNPGVSSDL